RSIPDQNGAAPPHEVEVSPHLVVEYRDVARGLIGDDDVVLVLMELVEDPTHRDDVVVGVGREYDDPLPPRQLAPPSNLGDERIEHLAVQWAGRSVPG